MFFFSQKNIHQAKLDAMRLQLRILGPVQKRIHGIGASPIEMKPSKLVAHLVVRLSYTGKNKSVRYFKFGN